MRWKRGARSGNLEDRRGATGGGFGGFGGGGFSTGGLGRAGKIGLPGGILAVVAIFLLTRVLGGSSGFEVPGLQGFPQVRPTGDQGIPASADPDRNLVDFVSFVLDDVQGTWQTQFRQAGRQYRPAHLVLFTDATETGCGNATSEVGPFYCPADETVYLDLDFFRELSRRFGAPGDFAQAYVIAHELGHHVQNLLGISDKVSGLQQQSPDQANELSVRLELQADCLAGVWGSTAKRRGMLVSGDLKEGLAAAAAVGDDRIQKQATGTTNPETWTHGSSEQRVRWFTAGFDSGNADDCDTFSTNP